MNSILEFNKINRQDLALVGGKGASLGEMVHAGIPVPEGFVITTSVFNDFLIKNDLVTKINNKLTNIDSTNLSLLEQTAKDIQNLILNKQIDSNIQEEIINRYRELKLKNVAVRSSATSEDSRAASWAGELETYLNVFEDKLIFSIKKCWASLFSSRAIIYSKKKCDFKNNSVAVVIQKMINSEKSGTAFSAHPLTGDSSKLVIEAGYGLGEAVVSGQITPDNYIIQKNNIKIIDKNISQQGRQLISAELGGYKWETVSDKLQRKQKMSDEQIEELSKIVVKIENHYGFPCDVEWVFKENKFYIVQCRPITAIDETNRKSNKVKVYKKIFNRYLPIYAAEYNYIGKTRAIKKITNGCANFPPLYINIPSKGNDVYYDEELYERSSKNAFEHFKKHPDEIKKISENYRKICESNFNFVKNAKVKDIKKLFDLNAHYISPMMTILILIGREEFDREKSEVSLIARDIRYWNDKILYEIGLKIFELINKKFSFSRNDDRADYLTITEILSGKLSSIKEINRRRKSWVLLEGKKLYTGDDIEKFLFKNHIVLRKENINLELHNDLIVGNIAYGGYAKGHVKVVFTIEDLAKIKKGDIMVSPMTGPDFILAIKNAGAIVTDEGGITCHAAIISRELKIPCLIGTKIATKVLKDRDLVEVDSNKGVVRVLKRINEEKI